MNNDNESCCMICGTPLKIKGMIMSGLLVVSAVATSVLSFTTTCHNQVVLTNNSTYTTDDIGTANKAMSISLLLFSVASAVFERYINKKLVDISNENDELKTINNDLKTRSGGTDSYNEPFNILSTPSPITPVETNRSDATSYYPRAIRFTNA